MAATGIGHACTITLGGGTDFARVENIEWGGVEVGAIETTYMALGAGGQTFLPEGNYNPGELTVTYQVDDAVGPPVMDGLEAIILTFADMETYTANGFLTSYSLSAPDKGAVMATATIKVSGDITW